MLPLFRSTTPNDIRVMLEQEFFDDTFSSSLEDNDQLKKSGIMEEHTETTLGEEYGDENLDYGEEMESDMDRNDRAELSLLLGKRKNKTEVKKDVANPKPTTKKQSP